MKIESDVVMTIIAKELQGLVGELCRAVERQYADQVVSIVLFGSATTGEWKLGRSDIDFIVMIKESKKKAEVEHFLNSILLRLDKQIGLQLSQTCCTYKRASNPIMQIILKIEDFFAFGKPFYVFALDQVDLEKGVVKDVRIRFITSFFDSLSIFLAKTSATGVVVYGSDILQRFKKRPSVVEKMRTAMAPVWLAIMALGIVMLVPRSALQHSVKATLWACEDALFALDLPLGTTREELDILSSTFSSQIDLIHIARTLKLRHLLGDFSVEISKGLALRHLVNTIFFILHLYRAVGERLKLPIHGSQARHS